MAIQIWKGWPMNDGKSVFAQLFEFLPLHEFRKFVRKYRGDYRYEKKMRLIQIGDVRNISGSYVPCIA